MRYEIVNPWHGVKVGDVVETDSLHDSLIPHVRKLPDEPPRQLEVASPKLGRPRKEKED